MKNSPGGIVLQNRNRVLGSNEWNISLEPRNIPGEITILAQLGTQILTIYIGDLKCPA